MPAVNISPVPAHSVRKFRLRLLTWFAARKRDLPWRRSRDPYRIWLSEVMLQQTRVAAATGYYERFVARFPDMPALARARPETVLRYWAGLGYYSRARNLHRAAKEIVVRHGGEFPRVYDAAVSLPGVGQYTAAAVLSIAYGQLLAVLDGNVARVLARLGAVCGGVREPARWRRSQAAAQELLDCSSPGDWNQAMMELGATLCTPRSPRCGECPVARWCKARALGIADQIPAPRTGRATKQVRLAVAVLVDPIGRTLLVRQAGDDGALFSKMWQFPALEIISGGPGQLAKHLREKFGVAETGRMTRLETARHAVTYRAIRLEPYLVRLAKLPVIKGARSPKLNDVRNLPVSNATRKAAAAAMARTANQPESRHGRPAR